MSETLIGVPVLAGSFVLALILGAIGNKTHFCTLGGVSDWVNMNDKGRLGAWFLAIAVAALGVAGLELMGLISLETTLPPYRSSNFSWLRYILGGLLFGIGMPLASGCASKTLIRIGGGNLKSLVVFVVIGLCAYLMTKTAFYGVVFHSWMQPLSLDLAAFGLTSQDLGSLLAGVSGLGDPAQIRLVLSVLLALGVVLFIQRSAGWRGNGNNILAGTVVGLCILGGWYLTAGPWGQDWIEAAEWLDEPPLGVSIQSFTFVNPIGETLSYATEPGNNLLLTFGVPFLVGPDFYSRILSGRDAAAGQLFPQHHPRQLHRGEGVQQGARATAQRSGLLRPIRYSLRRSTRFITSPTCRSMRHTWGA